VIAAILRRPWHFPLTVSIVLVVLLVLAGCGNRQCPAGFVNDGNDNCVSDGRGGNYGPPMDDDYYEGDDD
jgi:hypothetical protein